MASKQPHPDQSTAETRIGTATETNPAADTDTPPNPADYQRANLGCGDDYRGPADDPRKVWLNVDLDEREIGMDGRACQPDLTHDLNELPWPFPDDCFERVVMDNVLEHLDDQLAVLEELARVTQPGGIVEVSCPHWNSASMAVDPTHTNPVDYRVFDHYLVEDLFDVQNVDVTSVRWARALPDAAALWLADILGHGVIEWTVEAEVR